MPTQTSVGIDYEQCAGHGRCFALVPEVFAMGEDGRGMVRAEMLDSVPTEALDRAAALCPENAIAVGYAGEAR